jgi:cell division protein FtsL
MLACIFGLVLGASALTWTRSEMTRLRYRLAELSETRAELGAEVEKLSIEAAVLTAPKELERRARELGLHYPQDGQVVHVREAERPAVGARPPAGAGAPN